MTGIARPPQLYSDNLLPCWKMNNNHHIAFLIEVFVSCDRPYGVIVGENDGHRNGQQHRQNPGHQYPHLSALDKVSSDVFSIHNGFGITKILALEIWRSASSLLLLLLFFHSAVVVEARGVVVSTVAARREISNAISALDPSAGISPR